MSIELIMLKNNEPAVQLRAGDPDSNDAILAYLRNIVEGDGTEESVRAAVNVLFRFKEWQAEHSVGNSKEDPEAILRNRIAAWLSRQGGFVHRSEISRRYHLESDRFDRVIAPLELRAFRVETSGRPTTFYVLPEAVDLFRKHAQGQNWTFSEIKKEIFNSHLEM